MKKRPTLRANLSIVLSFIICFQVLGGLTNTVQAETFMREATKKSPQQRGTVLRTTAVTSARCVMVVVK